MTDPREVTQMSRVQSMLLSGPVCATTFLAHFMSSARSRVSELRAAGWSIEASTCDLGHNHATRQIMYRLTHGTGCRCPRCARFSTWSFTPSKQTENWSARPVTDNGQLVLT